jgi:hypothetical protein
MKNKNRIMIQFLAAIMAITVTTSSFSQDKNDKEEFTTIFGKNDGRIDYGGWGGLTFGYTQLQGYDTYLMGARGGWLIDHHFTIGLAGIGFISDHNYNNILPIEDYPYNPKVNLAGGYGGLFLEAILFPNYPVHINIPVIIGGGGVTYVLTQDYYNDPYYNNDYYYDGSSIDSDAFFVFEPGLEIELNVIKFMRFSIGGSYRYTSQIDLINTSSNMLRSFNGYFSLKFGSF